MDLDDVLQIADSVEIANAQTVKSSLPIAFVLEHYGIQVEQSEIRLVAHCPFHQDSTPSFSVYGDNFERWGCFASCGGGDVLDLLKMFEPELVPDGKQYSLDLLDKATELIHEMEEAEWTGPTLNKKRPTLDIVEAQQIVERSQASPDVAKIQEFINEKRSHVEGVSWKFSPEFLIDEFGVGTSGNWLIIPIYDSNNELVTYKRWTSPSDKRKAAVGSVFGGDLYNSWQEDDGRPIVICEGESDTWNAHYELGNVYRVLGLLSGAAERPHNPEQYRDRTVYLAFDGDIAGRKGSELWASVLSKHGANVMIVPIPDEHDVSTISGLRSLIGRSKPPVTSPNGLRITEYGYVRPGDSLVPISNWTFDPTRELAGENGTAYEGRLLPGGQAAVISSADLSTKNKTIGWSLKHGRSWYGSDRECQILLGMLQAQGTYLSTGRMASVAGLNDGHYVWPGGKIGPDYWMYVPPTADAGLAEELKVVPGKWSSDMVHTMRKIQINKVADPMLAWLAAAPLRSLFREFPILAISGPHGSGKTKTAEALVRCFSGSGVQITLTATTPYVVASTMSSTNAFPVHFDEYRPGARSDTVLAAEQLFRDAYTAQKSKKGGLKTSNWAELTTVAPIAPIVVTGEDMFSEGSHVDRMILLRMNSSGQQPEVFEQVRYEWEGSGFPFAYLTWLHKSLMDGTIEDILHVTPSGPGDLSTRQRLNLGVLNTGWRLLQRFMTDADDAIGEPNFDMVIEQLRSGNGRNPLEEAIHWCLGEVEATAFCKRTEKNVLLRVENFVAFVNRSGQFKLPAKAEGIRQDIIDKFGATEETVYENGLMRTYLSFPYKKIAR